MAAPPPAYSTPHAGNPDRRALPDGWITRYDDNYRAWYYVDTRSHPPRSSWDHPLGAPPAGNYPPPPNPPPNRGNFGGGGPPFSPQGSPPFSSSTSPYNQGTPYGGFQGNPAEARNFPPQSSYAAQPPYGAPAGNYGNPGNPAWPQQGWQQQPPTQLGYQSQPPSQAIQQPPRSGRNNALLAGGAGLIGGALLTEAFDHHEDEVRQDAYDQGFDDGQDNPEFGGGGDW